MTERDGTSVDIEFSGRRNFTERLVALETVRAREFLRSSTLDDGEDLRREGFVDFDDVRILQLEFRPGFRPRDGKNRPEPHPHGITTGVSIATNAPSGANPNSFARDSLITSRATAPSVIWEALPAVTVPLLRSNCGFNFASPSND